MEEIKEPEQTTQEQNNQDNNQQNNNEIENLEENFLEIYYFKYEFEGCRDINDILCNLDRLKQIFSEMQNEGYKLREDVRGGYCFLNKE